MKYLKNPWTVFFAVFSILIIVRACEQEPKVVTNTKVIYKTKIDTITKVFVDEITKTVFVERIKTEKGKDSIIYRDNPSDITIEANQFDASLEANNATANLKITTTGQLLDVTGIIKWEEKETTNNVIITKPKSGLFLYGQTSVNPLLESVGVGLDYQIRNSLIIGASANYNNISQHSYFNVKFGIRIF